MYNKDMFKGCGIWKTIFGSTKTGIQIGICEIHIF